MLLKSCFLVAVLGTVLPGLTAEIVEFRLDRLSHSSDGIKKAVTEEGAFLIAGLSDEFTKAYRGIATGLPECSEADADGVDTLDDGTVRITFAQRSLDGETSGFMARGSCPMHLAENMKEMSADLDYVGKEVAVELTDALSPSVHHPDLPSIIDILEKGREYHLDHVHIYQNRNDSAVGAHKGSSTPTLTWHTDQGAFLLLVLPPGDQSFHYKDSQGEETTLSIPNDGEVRVLVVMGNALRSTFFETTPPIRPLPHSVYLRSLSPGDPRVVIGRMFLPPADIRDSQTGLTYEAWSKQAMIPNPVFDTEEVIAEKRRLQTSCNSSSIQCWMRCMENTCSAGQTAVCWNNATQTACPIDKKMRPECSVGCLGSSGSTTKAPRSAATSNVVTKAVAAMVALFGLVNF
ncbi:hypothetical protein FOZ63_026310 [Perkinsus olseni]|uniref:Fe2OG dioxygenase domain-containing protein n=2 Tax=Perkinsus olseni TaxID=32597 RepID=A0A7J6SZF0_PEROL|nr:hypothetical protein FOZ63_026310 [Perkinsus olseni]